MEREIIFHFRDVINNLTVAGGGGLSEGWDDKINQEAARERKER